MLFLLRFIKMKITDWKTVDPMNLAHLLGPPWKPRPGPSIFSKSNLLGSGWSIRAGHHLFPWSEENMEGSQDFSRAGYWFFDGTGKETPPGSSHSKSGRLHLWWGCTDTGDPDPARLKSGCGQPGKQCHPGLSETKPDDAWCFRIAIHYWELKWILWSFLCRKEVNQTQNLKPWSLSATVADTKDKS